MSIFDTIMSLFSRSKGKTTFDEVLNHPENIKDETLAEILEKARIGNAENALYAGVLYLKGARVEQDPLKALDFLDKSARSGNTQAQKILSQEYLNGLIIPQDLKSAFLWCEKAANSGDLESMFNLGIMYKEGSGIDKDANKAIEWLQKASDLGSIKSKVAIADIFFNGDGLPRDRVKACQMYKGILQGDVSKIDVGRLYRDLGQAYADTFYESDLTKEEGMEFLKKAIQNQYFDAIRIFALLGNQLDDNDKKWLFGFASQNPKNPHCLFAMGLCYENGYGTDKNDQFAFLFYKQAADLGDSWGKHYAAQYYLGGRGVPQNLSEWLKLETQAAFENVAPAQYMLGVRYLKGIDVEQNQDQAINLLTKAANNHHSPAEEMLKQLTHPNQQETVEETPKTETEVKTEPETEIETQPTLNQSNPVTEIKVEITTEAETKIETQPTLNQSNPVTEIKTEPEIKPETKIETLPTLSQSHAVTEIKTKPEIKPEPETKTETQPTLNQTNPVAE